MYEYVQTSYEDLYLVIKKKKQYSVQGFQQGTQRELSLYDSRGYDWTYNTGHVLDRDFAILHTTFAFMPIYDNFFLWLYSLLGPWPPHI
jgi:hypothetical protein